jgi:hypothetical protein
MHRVVAVSTSMTSGSEEKSSVLSMDLLDHCVHKQDALPSLVIAHQHDVLLLCIAHSFAPPSIYTAVLKLFTEVAHSICLIQTRSYLGFLGGLILVLNSRRTCN